MTTADTRDYDDYDAPPDLQKVGETREWALPLDNMINGEAARFTGRFLGLGSSHRDTHINHGDGDHAPPRTSCSGCRWLESRIFRREDGWYLLYTIGESIVPGEEPRYRGEWMRSPYEIIDSLTTFRDDSSGQRVSQLSYAARRVLAQAAYLDEPMRDAYEGRVSSL